MRDYFDQAREGVRQRIREALEASSLRWDRAAPGMGQDAARRLMDFAVRGKMIRGVLVKLGYELAAGRTASGTDLEALEKAGAAMELFQSGLLVHDDIMDRDTTRRGFPTMHVGYERTLSDAGYAEPTHYGVALGICSGDLAYFAGFGILTALTLAGDAAREAARIASDELCLVGAAQMTDVANGAANSGTRNAFGDGPLEPTEADIIRLYRYKTGRYTFSLPLAMGAALSGAGPNARHALEAAGEELGILFQIKDDELGLFANEAELGKPLGSDLREDKKTLLRHLLFKTAAPDDQTRLAAIFGKHELDSESMEFVRAAVVSSGVQAELAHRMQACANAARSALGDLLDRAPEPAARAFRELVAYSLERSS
ncbi:MAG: polyprenyl synthetase family protein [Spirochaetia bacterium]|nr:polyprenyl synthetase family protein [Spirochaetia bacterium]